MQPKLRTKSTTKEYEVRGWINNLFFMKNTPQQEIITFNDKTKKKCFVFDIDGTLAISGGRSIYDYVKALDDTLNEPVAECLAALKIAGFDIIICSAREGTQECLEVTKQWLKKGNIEYKSLFTRGQGDKRADYIVKEEMWREICKTHYIEAMFDDRNQVVDHARKLGFNVFQVNYGDF